MGFSAVYRCLTDMFPQLDTRLLKAVAIEHSRDPEAAANAVLTDILPCWSKQAIPVDQSASSSSPKNQSPRGAEHEEQNTLCRQLVTRRRNKTLGSSPEPGTITSEYATNTDLADDCNSDSTSLRKALNASTVSHFYDANGGSEEVMLSRKTQEIGVDSGSNKVSTAMPHALMNYEVGKADFSQLCANTESIDSFSLDKGQDIYVRVDDLREVCANKKSNGSVSVDKGQDVNAKVDDFTEVCANKVSTAMPHALMNYEVGKADFSQLCANTESIDSFSLDKGQDINVRVDDLSEVCANKKSNGSVSVDKGQDVNAKVDDFTEVCVNTESGDSVSLDKGQDINVKVDDSSQVCINTENNSVLLVKGQPIIVNADPEQTPFLTSTCLLHVNGVADGTLTDWKDFDGREATSVDTSNCGFNYLVESSLDCPLEKVESYVAQSVQSSVQEHASDVPECALQSEIVSVTPSIDCGKLDSSGSADLTSKQENLMTENSDIEDESTINTVVTRSGQLCRIDLLEEIIEDAKNNKKTLFIAMESVMNLIGEVEIQEKAAAEAKEEAEKGGLDILVKVDELKQMLTHAKEANDIHAGEIYGEKAILATEARELQNRLLSLSEERDKSLAILEEMHEALKIRLGAAGEMKKAAEQEKLEKEESARNYLAEQEAIVEKVVQESKSLQNQAEENSKLQDFLMDRGCLVDSLQGEISVICQDVRLLKEKFDEHVPLSKSVLSSQTTCILASSSSSMKSMASLVAEQGLTSETSEKASPTLSVKTQSPKGKLEDGRTGDFWREPSDEGWNFKWDFFESDTELNIKAL